MIALGDPHRGFDAIHVAGTDGKGSTAAIANSILRAAGQRPGLFTSPHLIDFRERIRINGRAVPEDEAGRLLEELDPLIRREGSSFFEAATAMAFLHFTRSAVRSAVVETGLGGRLDSTNVLASRVSIVTAIGKDHCDLLGESLGSIAREKLAIAKHGTTLVSGIRQPRLQRLAREIAEARRCRLMQLGKDFLVRRTRLDLGGAVFDLQLGSRVIRGLRLPLLGLHQVRNAACAVAGADAFHEGGIPEEAVRAGLESVRWPGRCQYVRGKPHLLLDVAHNPSGARALRDVLVRLFPRERVIAVVGMMKDKKQAEYLRILEPLIDRFFFSPLDNPRAVDPAELAGFSSGRGAVAKGVGEALEAAFGAAGGSGLVLVSGSCVTVGEAMEVLGLDGLEEI